MGFLHEGHLSLVRAARAENDCVFVSIFVNPTQFGPNEDLSTYPRDMDRDLALLRAEGVDYVFVPAPEEMYPANFGTAVDVGEVALPLEGAARPGHFKGVATVVLKLLKHRAAYESYFGKRTPSRRRDQKRMVRDLDVPTQIVAMPTVREPDGLALSNRNAYLDADQRKAATVLHEASTSQARWTAGTRDVGSTKRIAEVDRGRRAWPARIRFDRTRKRWKSSKRIQGPALVSMAVRIGKTRLIDNVTLGGGVGPHPCLDAVTALTTPLSDPGEGNVRTLAASS